MCNAAFALAAHPNVLLVLCFNRDEFAARPTAPLHLWQDSQVPLYAGRDLQGQGTWLGITATGRFAFLTNVREVPAVPTHAHMLQPA